MDPLNTTSLARAQSAPTLLARTEDHADEANALVEASRQVGFVNTAHLAQALAQAGSQDPEHGAALRDAIDQLLSAPDRASLEQYLMAALPPDTPPIPRPGALPGSPMPVPADATGDAAVAQHAALRAAQAFDERGAEGAARMLRELTESATPALAARILQQAQPTVEKIAGQLGNVRETPRAAGEEHNPLRTLYADQQVIADLSAAASRAGEDAANWPVIRATAATLTRRIDGSFGKLAFFDSAFGFSVAHGAGASLAIAVIDELKATGRDRQASAILDDVATGVERLHHAVGRTSDAYVKARREELHLSASYGSWATDPSDDQQAAAVQGFWDEYERTHPQLAQTQAELDRAATAAARTAVELKQHEGDFAGLSAAPRAKGAASQLINDGKVLESVLASPAARRYLADRPDFFSYEGAAKLLGLRASRDGRSFLQRLAIASVKGQMEIAVRGMDAGDHAAVAGAINSLQRRVTILGLSGERKAAIDQMLTGLAEINRASAAGESLQRGLDQFNAAKSAFGEAAPTMNTSTLLGAAVRGWGLVLSAGALAKQVGAHVEEGGDARRYLQEFYGLASTLQQAAMIGTGLAHRLNLPAGGVDRVARMARLDNIGDLLAGIGAMVDAANAAANLSEGDLPGAALSGTSALANYLLWQGYTTGADGARTGLLKSVAPFSATWGFGVSGSALVRAGAWLGLATAPLTIGYEMHKEASKYETPTTENYLKALGFKPDVAHALRDHTFFSGRSPGPIFGQLAGTFGLNLLDPADSRTWRAYLNSLSKEQITQAVRAAHEIAPDSRGGYPATAGNDDDLLKPQEYLDTGNPESPVVPRYDHEPRSIQGMKNWLIREGYPLPQR